MAEESSSHREGSHAGAWGLGVSCAVLFYILSPPPLVWVLDFFRLGKPEFLRYLYAPLILLYDNFEVVKKFYDGYYLLVGGDR